MIAEIGAKPVSPIKKPRKREVDKDLDYPRARSAWLPDL
jgi:hypothetical protein